jgi:hypothetical protein
VGGDGEGPEEDVGPVLEDVPDSAESVGVKFKVELRAPVIVLVEVVVPVPVGNDGLGLSVVLPVIMCELVLGLMAVAEESVDVGPVVTSAVTVSIFVMVD